MCIRDRPASGQTATVTVDCVPFDQFVEARPPSYLPARIVIDDAGDRVPQILGTARLIGLECRALGVVNLAIEYVPEPHETHPTQFRLRRTAGPSTPADVVRVLTVNGRTRFNVKTGALLDTAAYTFELIGEAGALAKTLLSGITVEADATGPSGFDDEAATPV